jgi:hypothetical protein
MKKNSKTKQPKKSQHDLFKETTKEHGCNENFDLKKAIKKISKVEMIFNF